MNGICTKHFCSMWMNFMCIKLAHIGNINNNFEVNENRYWRNTFFCYRKVFCLVDLLHGWSTVASGRSTARGAGHSTLEALGHATASATVQFGEDRLHDSLQLLLTILVLFFLSKLVSVEPSQEFRGLLLDRAAIIRADFVLELFIVERVFDVE